MSHVYVVEVKFKDGRTTHPVVIPTADSDWEQQLEEAMQHFQTLYGSSALVEVLYARDVHAAGVVTPDSIRTWKDFRLRPWG